MYKKKPTSSFTLTQTNGTKVDKCITTLSNSKAKDIYGLDTALIKKNKETITSPITQLINKCIDESTFPSALKLAIITLVYKSGGKEEVRN